MFGLRDIGIERREEAERLCRADLIIAIQDEERAGITTIGAISSRDHCRRRF